MKPAKVEELLESYTPAPVVHQLRYSILKKIRAGEDVLPEIQGRTEVKEDVIRAILSGAHAYLVSEEGTGKTRLARSLTKLLPPAIRIGGCPYNDDPKWPPERLCPRCRSTKEPVKAYGVELIPGELRISRIQGNEYTNEAKLLGLKDIQAIAQGKSPADPIVFTGTGVFRANRGILFIDELPAIRTNVQVLLHPILEEKRVILEEYHWYHPVDLLVIATGNPKGFSHVYEVPRPLLDRLELIYMDLPEEDVEKEIMIRERFSVDGGLSDAVASPKDLIPCADLQREIRRTVVAPWWIVDILNKTIRYSRMCTKLERKASIRAGSRALDHTYANVEMGNRAVANLKDAYYGLRLALRGRIGLGSEYLDFDDPRVSFKRTDRLVEDLMWNALEDLAPAAFEGYDKAKLADEIKLALACGVENVAHGLEAYGQLARAVESLKRVAVERVYDALMTDAEKKLARYPGELGNKVIEEYNKSALEMVINLAVHSQIVSPSSDSDPFIPRRLTDFKSW